MRAIIYKLLLEERYSITDFFVIYVIAVIVHNLF